MKLQELEEEEEDRQVHKRQRIAEVRGGGGTEKCVKEYGFYHGD